MTRSSPAPDPVVIPLPGASPRHVKQRGLRFGDEMPANVCRIRTFPAYEPLAIPVTPERVALRAIFESLTGKQRRTIIGRLWKESRDGEAAARLVAMAMLRGEKI